MLKNILQTTSRVEAPFIEVDINGFVFGKYTRKVENVTNPVQGYTRKVIEYFPNYVKTLNITKVNGSVNIYDLQIVYVIQPGDDPNKIDKVLSTVSSSRKMILSYGDYNSPSYIFRDEEAMITGVKSNIDVALSMITYTISAVSTAKLATQNKINEPAFTGKPSEKIKKMLYDYKYGLQDIFYGMRLKEHVNELIAGNDRVVQVQAKTNISTFDYINYLVSCMCSESDTDEVRHRYTVVCRDDLTGKYGGPYFTVTEVPNNIQSTTALDMYELTIGFPEADAVLSFLVNQDDAYALLYNYAEQQKSQNYVCTINNDGSIHREYVPSVLKSNELLLPTELLRTWWSLMTSYPISATVTLKGLLRPAILMTCIKLNTYFFGRKHTSSGTYIVTLQQDTISENGFRTTLQLTRIKGESI